MLKNAKPSLLSPPRSHTPLSRRSTPLSPVKRHSDGVIVLGIPHGSDMFIQSELSAIVDKTELGLHELRKLAWYHRDDSMQCALLLLRYCAVPRFSHVLRALPPNTVASVASAHRHHELPI